ncbi:hypothetical protein CKO27_18800 [Thiocystis violacea]|nr:hypothetical protein [Thiocystis violacea]
MLAPGRRLAFVLVTLIAGPGLASDWTGSLHDGSRLEVDPSTHKAWRLDGGQRAPLWDGVHRLDDGSVLIIRDGIAVPNAGMLETWDQPTPQQVSPAVPEDCRALIRRVCGENERCGATEPCRLARELSDMAKEAPCREALGNGFFVPCN